MEHTDKFKSIVHTIIHDCDHPMKLGAIRLNKILWFADVIAYRETGESITGATYVRRHKGPVPARIVDVLGELQQEGKIEVKEPKSKYAPREFRSLKGPVQDNLSKDEKDLIDLCRNHICNNFSAGEISELTHNHIWGAARDGEEIPLEATLMSEKGNLGDLTPEMKDWALKTMKDYHDSGHA